VIIIAVPEAALFRQLAVFLGPKSLCALKEKPKMFYNFWFECVLKQVNIKVFLCFEKHLPS